MPRANRISRPGLVWHVTHRCHEKAFLLRFAKDRRIWRHWLFEARRRYRVCVLNYIVTCNHIHLLVLDRGRGELPASMRLVAGRTAQAYNRRKRRRGAFWEDRYHATAVQADVHLARCMTYIDLNMVRAGAVSHPAEWDVSGFSEIQNPWQRKGIIDFEALCQLLGHPNRERVAMRLKKSAEANMAASQRDAAWTEAVGVGDDAYLRELKRRLGARALYRRIDVDNGVHTLRDGDPGRKIAKIVRENGV